MDTFIPQHRPYQVQIRHPCAKERFMLQRYLAAQHLQVMLQPSSISGIDQTLPRLRHERGIRPVART